MYFINMSQTYSHTSCARSTGHFHSCGVVSGKWPPQGGGETEGCQPTSRLRAFDGILLCSGISDAKQTRVIIVSAIAASQHRSITAQHPPAPPHTPDFFVFKMKNGETCWQKGTRTFDVLSLPLCFKRVAGVFQMLSPFASFSQNWPDSKKGYFQVYLGEREGFKR